MSEDLEMLFADFGVGKARLTQKDVVELAKLSRAFNAYEILAERQEGGISISIRRLPVASPADTSTKAFGVAAEAKVIAEAARYLAIVNDPKPQPTVSPR